MSDEKQRGSRASYRPEIDGLRAIAVLLVLAFHFGVSRVKGGFVGVDVFFVISGYLISSHIIEELRLDRFTLASFYERRIRRIFPALLVVLVASSACAFLYLTPTELVDFGWSVGAAVLSVSNVLFYRQSGYFAAPSSSKPLLHTWSLGVEEQFYLVLPLLLMWTWRVNRRAIPAVVWIAGAVSLLHSVLLTQSDREAGFFLATSRAWELLLGTLLALTPLPGFSKGVVRELAAGFGILAIIASGLSFSSETPFPGLAALVPCLGAALVIAAGQNGSTVTTRALSLRPFVTIGLMSYSLYLWHWPLYVFESMGAFPLGLGGRSLKVGLFAATFVISFLSWRLVELPVRFGRLRLSRNMLFCSATAMVAGFCLTAWLFVSRVGYPDRFPAAAVRMAGFLKYDYRPPSRVGVCMIDGDQGFDIAKCVAFQKEKRNYLLLGDSHAAALWGGMAAVYSGVNVMQVTGSNCKIQRDGNGPTDGCRKLMRLAFTNVMTDTALDGVLLAARWGAADLGELGESIAWMKDHHIAVTVFGPVPQYDAPLPRLLALEIKTRDAGLADRHFASDVRALDQRMAALAKTTWNVPYISIIDVLCDSGRCVHLTADDVPIQYDYGHFTLEGSRLVAARLRDGRILKLP